MGFLSSRLLSRHFGTTVVFGLALHLLAFVSGALPAWAQTGPPPSEPQRPALQIGNAARFDEDWSVLKGVDLSKTDDFWDRVKFIPLTADGSVWLSIGGQVRERGEYFRHFLFGSSEPEDTDAYLASRYRLSADLYVTRYFRMFAEGKSAFVLDRDLVGGRTTSFVNELDLLNGFADIMIPLGEQASVTLRGGRQELIFGAQRLVGVSDFTNAFPRTWDGGRGIIGIGDWSINPFWAQLVVVDKYKFDKSTSDTKLFGIYSTGPLPFVPVNLDVYWLSADNAGATFNGTPGRERRQTLGARTWARLARQTWTSRSREPASSEPWAGGTLPRGCSRPSSAIPCLFRAWVPASMPSSTMRAATASPAATSAPSANSNRAATRFWGIWTTSDGRTSSAPSQAPP